jgi:hypothetical protein
VLCLGPQVGYCVETNICCRTEFKQRRT